MLNFQQWLLSADGGLKSEKSAKQHSYQAKTIAAVIGKASLQKFLSEFIKETKFMQGTTKSYLSSLVHFGNYLLTQKCISDVLHIQTMLGCIKRWIKAFLKRCSERALLKTDNDLQYLVTTKDIQSFELSAVARETIQILAEAELQGHCLPAMSMQSYILVRDYLLSSTVLANGNRSGVLANMTVEEVLNAKEVDDCLVVSVAKHKTAWTTGPAKLVLSRSLYSWVTLLVTKILPQMFGSSDSHGCAFLSVNGQHVKWADNQSPTIIVEKSSPKWKNFMHADTDLMRHRTETAAKCYRVVHQEKTCVSSSKDFVRCDKT